MVKKRASRWISRLSLAAAVAAMAVLATAERALSAAPEQFNLGFGADYGVLTYGASSLTFSGTGDNVYGDIGIGNTTPTGTATTSGTFSGGTATGTITAKTTPGNFTGTGSPSLTPTTIGPVNFATTSGSYTAGTMTYSPSAGNPVYSDQHIGVALTNIGTNSATFTGETGTPVAITNGGSVNVTSGTLDANGNYVFTATVSSFTAGNTFTIFGTLGQTAIFNFPSGTTLDGAFKLEGPGNVPRAISTDAVLYNVNGGVMTVATGYSSNHLVTEGTFLDPTGSFAVSGSYIEGHVIGGGSSTFASSILVTPEPSSFVLAGMSILALFGFRRVVSQRKGKLA